MSDPLTDPTERKDQTVYCNKLSDGHDPVELGAHLRDLLERGFRFVHQHTGTWLNPAGVKATLGYAGGSYRLSLYQPGQVAGPPVSTVDMDRLDQRLRAEQLLGRWAQSYPTPIGDATTLVAQIAF